MLEFLSCATENPGRETDAAAAAAATARPFVVAAAAAVAAFGRYWDSENSPVGTVPEDSAAAY